MCCCPECVDTDGRGASSLLHVTLQEEHNGRVALRRLFELFQRDLVVVVLIHFAEDPVHPLLRCQSVLVHLHHDHSAHHFVNSLRTGVRHREKLAKDYVLLCNPIKPTFVYIAWIGCLIPTGANNAKNVYIHFLFRFLMF